MPAPYDYRIRPVDVGNYFDAFRQGRADRMAAEGEARNRSLSEYLPGALEGDASARKSAMAATAGDPGMTMQLSQALAGADQQRLGQARELNGRIASLAAWADTPEKWTVALAEAKKLSPEIGDVPFEQRGAIIAKAQTLSEQFDQMWEQKRFGLQERQFAEGARHNRAMEGISAINAAYRAPGQRPLPQGTQKSEDADIEAIQAALGMNTQLGQYVDLIDSGKLTLGPVSNVLSGVQNFTGASSVGSQNYALFKSDLEKIRNESLRLNSGVQTEGDAQRAWNELVTNINDPALVKKQIARIQELNNRAIGFKQQAIAIRRARNNADPFDFQSLLGPQDTPADVPPPAPSGPTRTPIVKTQAEFDALPSGTVYVEPDGKRYRKP